MSTSEKRPRRTEYIAVEDLVADEMNPKAHKVDVITASIDRFGYIEPIVRDDRTGRLISGHGRTETLLAMIKRGESPPEGVVIGPDGRWLAPVAVGWSSRSDSEARAALIALNRTTEVGGWVDDALLDLLDTLTEDGDITLADVGFTEDDAETLRRLADSAPGGVARTASDEFKDAGLDYDNDDRHKAYFKASVSFATEEDYEEFRERLGLEGPRRPRLWYPEQPDAIESDSELVLDLSGGYAEEGDGDDDRD